MEKGITFVGLDTHKETITPALAVAGRDGEVRSLGRIANRPVAVERLSRELAKRYGALRFSYEAGPCGYGLYRQLRRLGHDCVVVAPALIPRRPGDRIKTDRRDSLKLARQDRAGELTEIWVPDVEDEAMRDLVRARAAAVEAVTRVRQQLQGLLLRNGIVYEGRTRWTRRHRSWLAGLCFEQRAQQIVLAEYRAAHAEAEARRDRLTHEIERLMASWKHAPLVAALQAMRGVALVTAATLVAEIGDFRRFSHPRQLMAYLGQVPSENSSGPRVRRGGITKAGNGRVRRVLTEAAWTYLAKPGTSAALEQRRDGLPKAVREIAAKAETRLAARFRHLLAAGKQRPLVVTAVAREMIGFLWAIAHAIEIPTGEIPTGEIPTGEIAPRAAA
jgi:transposase